MSNQSTEGAVIAAIVANRRVLLIRQPERLPPMWKFPGGGIESGEDLEVALVREIGDETGFKIPILRGPRERWVLGDNTIRLVHRSVRTCPSTSGGTHPQHFFVFTAPEKDVLFLGNQKGRQEDTYQLIDTKIFNLDEVRQMPDFLQRQRPLLEQVLALNI